MNNEGMELHCARTSTLSRHVGAILRRAVRPMFSKW